MDKKEACNNCVWFANKKEWLANREEKYYCVHQGLDTPKEIDIYKFDFKMKTPDWCPGFFPEPEGTRNIERQFFKFWSYRFKEREKGKHKEWYEPTIIEEDDLDKIDETIDSYYKRNENRSDNLKGKGD